MRLRHKAPINSYKGQTNHDASSQNDEDFEKVAKFSKKHKIAKQRHAIEKIKNYGDILVHLTYSVNQHFRSHQQRRRKQINENLAKEKMPLRNSANQKQKITPLLLPAEKQKIISKNQQNIKHTQAIIPQLPKKKTPVKPKDTFQEKAPKNKTETQELQKEEARKKVINLTNQQIEKAIRTPTESAPQQKNQEIPTNMFANQLNFGMMDPLQMQIALMYGIPGSMNWNSTLSNYNPYYAQMNLLSLQNRNWPNVQNFQQILQASSQIQNYIPFNKLPFPTQSQMGNGTLQAGRATAVEKERLGQNNLRSQNQKTQEIISRSIQPINGQEIKSQNKWKTGSRHVEIAYQIYEDKASKKSNLNKRNSKEDQQKMNPVYFSVKAKERRVNQKKNLNILIQGKETSDCEPIIV